MTKKVKNYIYSTYLKEYINIADIAELIIFNDFPNSDAGYFALYAVIMKDGFKWFKGKISLEYSTWNGNLNNLAFYLKNNIYNKEIKLCEIGTLYTKPDATISNDDLFWDDLWKKITKQTNKLAKEIFEAQQLADKEKREQSVII